jgi:hypothetical protein
VCIHVINGFAISDEVTIGNVGLTCSLLGRHPTAESRSQARTAERVSPAGLANPTLKAQLADLGGTTLPGPAADFGKFIAEEAEKRAKVVKFAGAKPD